jgi:hypothetical protein
MSFIDLLQRLHACTSALAELQSSTLENSWNTCQRPDWLLWFAARLGIDNTLLSTACLAVAGTNEKALAFASKILGNSDMESLLYNAANVGWRAAADGATGLGDIVRAHISLETIQQLAAEVQA